LEVLSIGLTNAVAAIASELEVYRLTQLLKQEQQPVKHLTEQEQAQTFEFSHFG
jgi:hypothetical protein